MLAQQLFQFYYYYFFESKNDQQKTSLHEMKSFLITTAKSTLYANNKQTKNKINDINAITSIKKTKNHPTLSLVRT